MSTVSGRTPGLQWMLVDAAGVGTERPYCALKILHHSHVKAAAQIPNRHTRRNGLYVLLRRLRILICICFNAIVRMDFSFLLLLYCGSIPLCQRTDLP